MLASLPGDDDIDKVCRYEAHLSRLWGRTLSQLEQVRRMFGQGGQAEDAG
jgi:hypothetical protein